MEKNKRNILIALLLVLLFFIIIFLKSTKCKKNNNLAVNVNLEVSNKKIGWGIMRNDKHEQPDLGSKNFKILKENHGLAVGNKEEKRIYLTFDEGYEAGYTKKILEILKQNNVKATFFITAHYLNTQEDLVKQMIEENHIVRKSYCKTSFDARFNRTRNKR